jgi:hypothetical protein
MMRHALAVRAHFDWAVGVTLAAPAEDIARLVAPGLRLDADAGTGFLAAAAVQTRRLRPEPLPAALGLDFLLVGYRVFVRFKGSSGEHRGLQILGSETDGRLMSMLGNLFTHYGYRRRLVTTTRTNGRLSVETDSGLRIGIDAARPELPAGSPFTSWAEARKFAGPMPYTFAAEKDGRIVRVRGTRAHWEPRPVALTAFDAPFLTTLVPSARPAAAFLVEDVDYRWEPGRREAPLPE